MRRINSIVVLFLFLLIAVLAAIGFSREGNEGINFRETGNIVLGGAGRLPSVWYLIYEEPDAPSLAFQLVFNDTSKCEKNREVIECGLTLSNGARAEIGGFREKDILIVKDLLIELEGEPLSDTLPVQLFYYDAKKDKDALGVILCSAKGLVPVERKVPNENSIEETIKLLIHGELTQLEKKAGITTEFPLAGLTLANSSLQNGTLILTFNDPQHKTSGGSCRAAVLSHQIIETARQFPEVSNVKMLPEELFQP
ncbi:MAG TPA: GerMN domain-containing protein [Candidatus Paceibacterota bacterium]